MFVTLLISPVMILPLADLAVNLYVQLDCVSVFVTVIINPLSAQVGVDGAAGTVNTILDTDDSTLTTDVAGVCSVTVAT
jgi:hypothetical protein